MVHFDLSYPLSSYLVPQDCPQHGLLLTSCPSIKVKTKKKTQTKQQKSLPSSVNATCMCIGPSTQATYQWPHPQKKNDSFSYTSQQLPTAPQLGIGPCDPLPHPCWSFAGLLFCRPCAGNHSQYEFLSAIVMPCPNDYISQHSFLFSGSFIFSAHPLYCSLSLRVGELLLNTQSCMSILSSL